MIFYLIYFDNSVRDSLLIIKSLKSLKFIWDVNVKTKGDCWVFNYKILELILFVHIFFLKLLWVIQFDRQPVRSILTQFPRTIKSGWPEPDFVGQTELIPLVAAPMSLNWNST